jgi:hypothetical protein
VYGAAGWVDEEGDMDWTHLQRHAAELHELADRARTAAALATAVDGVEWRSVAADRFRSALANEAALTRRCADLLDDAGQALAAHARAVHSASPVPTSR